MSESNKMATLADRAMEFVSEQSVGLQTLAPFLELFRDQNGIRKLRQDSAFVVGQVCNFAPEEFILAAGAVSVRLDMFYGEIGASDSPFPVDVCSAVRQLAVCVINPAVPLDLLIIGASCDARSKLAYGMSSEDKVVALEVPRSKRAASSMTVWHRQMRVLMERLEKLTGRRIRRKALLESIELLNRRTSIMRAINDLRTLPAVPITGAQALLVIHASFVSHPRWWCERAQSLLEQLQQRLDTAIANKPKVRLLLTGSSVMWPDYSLLMDISATGAEVVADETCAGSNHLHHPVVVDEKNLGALVNAVSEKALLPHSCPFFSEFRDRMDRILGLIRRYNIDGVVHHSLRGCQLFQMDFPKLKAVLDKRDIPCLDIHTELGQGGKSSVQNRIEAFIEMLSSRFCPPDV